MKIWPVPKNCKRKRGSVFNEILDYEVGRGSSSLPGGTSDLRTYSPSFFWLISFVEVFQVGPSVTEMAKGRGGLHSIYTIHRWMFREMKRLSFSCDFSGLTSEEKQLI